MQAAAPELIDLSSEDQRTLDEYGVTRPEPKKYSYRGGRTERLQAIRYQLCAGPPLN